MASTQKDKTEKTEQDTKKNNVKDGGSSTQTTDKTPTKKKDTTDSKPTVLKKEVKPIKVAPTPTGGGEKTMAKDPMGMFTYSGCKTYKVKAGDSLFDIAQKYVVAMQQLRYFNHIAKNGSLKVGQTLYIPKEPINVPYGE